MSFKDWLLEIGKSAKTADSYSRAISGVISTWANDAGLCEHNLSDIHTMDELSAIASSLEKVAIYQDRNKQGKNMYSCALKAYIEFRSREAPAQLEQDVNEIISDTQIKETEKATYVSARVGQGKYRSDLIGYWEKCALTGFSDVRFLVASHIKPWSKATHRERLDPYNGLLLLPNIDKAFDLGFISFAEGGMIIVSSHMEKVDKLGLNRDMQLHLEDAHQEYMRFHRENVFERLVK